MAITLDALRAVVRSASSPSIGSRELFTNDDGCLTLVARCLHEWCGVS